MCFHVKQILLLLLLLCIYLVSLETICLFISYTSRVSDVVPLLFFMCRLLYAKPENRSKSPKTPECSVIVCLPVYIASYQKFWNLFFLSLGFCFCFLFFVVFFASWMFRKSFRKECRFFFFCKSLTTEQKNM